MHSFSHRRPSLPRNEPLIFHHKIACKTISLSRKISRRSKVASIRCNLVTHFTGRFFESPGNFRLQSHPRLQLLPLSDAPPAFLQLGNSVSENVVKTRAERSSFASLLSSRASFFFIPLVLFDRRSRFR